jgi:hypothetical protein
MSRVCVRGSIAEQRSHMPNQLLDRQVRLLAHLTSGAGIFGADSGASAEPARLGIDGGLLHLEARFSHAKRMEKIEWVLTTTLDLLGGNRTQIVSEFVEACPPVSISWLENARQFYDFLLVCWRRELPVPSYLPDVAAYELAYATVRAGESRVSNEAAMEDASLSPPGAIRRHPGTVLLRCAYDIRPILEGRAGEAGPTARETRLAVAMLPGTDEPLVSELSSDIFELLEMLDQFADPAIFEDTPGLDTLIADLAAHGLVEVRR